MAPQPRTQHHTHKGYLAGLSLIALRNPVCCEPVGTKPTFSMKTNIQYSNIPLQKNSLMRSSLIGTKTTGVSGSVK